MINYRKIIKEENAKLVYDLAEKLNVDISNYDINELMTGITIEREHDSMDPKKDTVHDPTDLLKIAMVHLDENPKYYTKLKYAKL
jgi:hypothetical protein